MSLKNEMIEMSIKVNDIFIISYSANISIESSFANFYMVLKFREFSSHSLKNVLGLDMSLLQTCLLYQIAKY